MAISNPREQSILTQLKEDIHGFGIDATLVNIPRCRCSLATQAACNAAMAAAKQIINPGTPACIKVMQSRRRRS